MSACCTRGLDEVFDNKFAERDARRYRKSGLPPRSRKLLAAIETVLPLANRSVLEGGVGAGAFIVELLRRGAGHAVAIDAAHAQLASTRQLAREYNVDQRTEFVHGDFATTELPPADLVVLDRVVCCYPEWRPLLTRATHCAKQVIALTYPRDTRAFRFVHTLMDFWFVITRSDFRFHIHPIPEMQQLLRQAGFDLRVVGKYYWWEILVAERAR